MRRTLLDWFVATMPVRGSRIGDKLLGVMEAYLDESGISDIGPVCVVGGYVGGYRQFRRLEAEWKEIVSCLPNGDFHAIDFFNRGPNGERYGVYEGWTDQLANDFFEALASAIDESGVHPVGAAADVKKFFEYDIDTRIYLTGGRHNVAKWKTSGSPHQPYYLPFQHCLTKGITYVQEGIRLNFICDVNKELSRYAKDLFEDYKKVNPRMYERFGMISYASRLDANIIQAADLLGISPFTVKCWRERGQLRPVKEDVKPLLFREVDVLECHRARMTKAMHDHLDTLWALVLADVSLSA